MFFVKDWTRYNLDTLSTEIPLPSHQPRHSSVCPVLLALLLKQLTAHHGHDTNVGRFRTTKLPELQEKHTTSARLQTSMSLTSIVDASTKRDDMQGLSCYQTDNRSIITGVKVLDIS